MRGIVPAAGKSLMALICSLLMVFEPVFAAQNPSENGPATNSGPMNLNEAPAVAAMLAAFLLPAHPEPSAGADLIAVAKLTGTAERNGRPLLNGSIVSSGDVLITHRDSALLLAPTPEERLWLGPNTSAKFTKDAGNVAVVLERGTLGFQTRGHIQVTLEKHDGLAIRSRANSLALAQLSFVNGQQAQVQLQEGSLELVQGNRSIPLQAEPSRAVSVTGNRSPAGSALGSDLGAGARSQTQSNVGTVKGTVVDSKLFAVSGANVTLTNATGTSLKTASDAEGKFTFSDVLPGTYTLNVAQTGFPNYEQKDVVVTSGKESSLYVQLGGGGGGTKNKGLLIGVIVAAAAGGIAAAVAAGGHSSSSASTSTTQ